MIFLHFRYFAPNTVDKVESEYKDYSNDGNYTASDTIYKTSDINLKPTELVQKTSDLNYRISDSDYKTSDLHYTASDTLMNKSESEYHRFQKSDKKENFLTFKLGYIFLQKNHKVFFLTLGPV